MNNLSKIIHSILFLITLSIIAYTGNLKAEFGSLNKVIDSATEIELKPTNYVELDGYFNVLTQQEIRFNDLAGGEYAAVKAPATIASSYTLVLPDTDGAANEILETDGAGVLSWITAPISFLFTASTDNALIKADTIGANEIQESGILIDDSDNVTNLNSLEIQGSGYADFAEIASPATPASGFGRVYIDSTTKKLATRDDAGAITDYDAGGGASESVSTQSGSYTILDGDGFTTILFDDTSTDRTATLPTVADNTDRIIRIKNTSTDKGKVTLDGEGAETIDGFTTIDLDFKQATIVVQSDGTSWHILSESITDQSKEYTMTCAVTNWTTVICRGVPYRTLDGRWHLRFAIRGTMSVASSNLSVAVTGVSFVDNSAIAAWQLNSSTRFTNIARVNATDLVNVIVDTASTAFSFSGDVELTAKPTFVE